MTYEQALAYIHGRPRPPVRLDGAVSQQRFFRLLSRLGNPHKGLRCVHIAGSSGKGSTAAMTESVLRHAGYKTGLFISPYVCDFRERIQIAGHFVSKQALCRALERLIPHAEEMALAGEECLEFDLVTALAFMLFQEAECQIIALEVGLGGLTDRTNVIDAPEVAAICAISLEHTEYLGHTLAEIARHKCGIIKPGCRVAAYPVLPSDAQAVLDETCRRLGITPHRADLGRLEILELSPQGSRITYLGRPYTVALAGEHQVMNALTVLSIVEELRQAGWEIPEAAVARGLAATRFAGRLQIVRQKPTCLIDGAHNPEKVASLGRALDTLYPGRPIIAVMGMKREKDHAWCIPHIARRSRIFIAVTPGGMGRHALPAELAAELARPHCPRVLVCEDPEAAGRLALSLAGEDDVVVACGSLYILSAAKRGLADGPE